MASSSQHAFETFFKTLVPDLGAPDLEGWSSGTCPYCGEAGAFRANLRTGRWTCAPAPIVRVEAGHDGRDPR
jgi:hypothetical protein